MSGALQLGYLVFEVSDLGAWKDFGTKILGLGVVGAARGQVHLHLVTPVHVGFRQRRNIYL